MKCLLDTHTLVWFSISSDRLSERVRAFMTADEHDFFVSAATSFEIATKHRLGKLPEAARLLKNFEQEVEHAGFQLLSITSLHARTAGEYPQTHKDPFDRLLVAQASIEQMTLLSADTQLDVFNIKRLW